MRIKGRGSSTRPKIQEEVKFKASENKESQSAQRARKNESVAQKQARLSKGLKENLTTTP